jgi:hypothetical protein
MWPGYKAFMLIVMLIKAFGVARTNALSGENTDSHIW